MNSEVAGCDRIARELEVLASGYVRWELNPKAAVLGDAAKELNCSRASSYLAIILSYLAIVLSYLAILLSYLAILLSYLAILLSYLAICVFIFADLVFISRK